MKVLLHKKKEVSYKEKNVRMLSDRYLTKQNIAYCY